MALTLIDKIEGEYEVTKKYYFLNIDFGKKRSGIENSSLLRSRIFNKYLDIYPIFITAQYNNHLLLRKNELIDSKLVSPNAQFLNPYTYYQNTAQGQKQNTNLNLVNGWSYENIKGTYDYRIYDEHGKLIIYRVCDENGNLSYNNIFSNGKKIRRDYYDHNGYLSKVQHLDYHTGNTIFETYYTIDQNICMYKHFKIENNKNVLIKIHLVNQNGFIEQSFNTEQELLDFWLKSTIPNSENEYLIIDKQRVFYPLIKNWKENKRKIICCIHNSHLSNTQDYLEGKINSNYKEIFDELERPDAVVVLTKKQKEHIEERYGEKSNVIVIPHSMEKEIIPIKFEEREPYKCIYLARFSPEKQHDKIIRIFEEVIKVNPNIKLYLYGYGSEKNKIQAEISNKGLNNSIVVQDFSNNVEEIYNSAQLSVATSRVEGFSLFMLESLSYGVPLVSFDINYCPSDMIEHGINGYLIDKFNEDEMVKAILNAFANEGTLKSMSENAYTIREKFHSDRVAQSWLQLLNSI